MSITATTLDTDGMVSICALKINNVIDIASSGPLARVRDFERVAETNCTHCLWGFRRKQYLTIITTAA